MKVGYILILFVIMSSCTDDKDVFKGEYPALDASVANITSQGATFVAGLSNKSTKSITDRGFVWREVPNYPTIPTSEMKSLGPDDGSDSFSAQITSNMIAKTSYYVRSYVITNGITVYSDVTKFISNGSSGPMVTDFTPKSAKATVTITITGSGFSSVTTHNIVKLNTTVVPTTLDSENTLEIQIPTGLSGSFFTLSVTTAGKTSVAATQFQLIP